MPKPGGLFDKSNLLLGTEACGDGHGDMRNAGGMHAKMMRNLKKKPGPPPEGGLSYDDFVKQEAAKKIQKGYKESPLVAKKTKARTAKEGEPWAGYGGAPAHAGKVAPMIDSGNGRKTRMVIGVRCRPMSGKELSKGSHNCIEIEDGQTVYANDPDDKMGGLDYLRLNVTKDKAYTFDHAFGTKSTSEEVYDKCVKGVVKAVIAGFHGSCFAYGATGSGKTHTMAGTESDPGVMPRAIADIFKLAKQEDDFNWKFSLTYIEIYNERIRDLLNPSEHDLDVREDPKKGNVVAGAVEVAVTSLKQIMELMEKGSMHRTTESTNCNQTSSRSHAVMQINCVGVNKFQERGRGKPIQQQSARLSMIDLAGSERAYKTDNRGERLREGRNINRSLLSLANCINALADKSKKNQHVPYRDSKLTRLLRDSLSGTSVSAMLCAISPSADQFEETLNTLKYANRAKEMTPPDKLKKNTREYVPSDEKVEVLKELKESLIQTMHQLTPAPPPPQPRVNLAGRDPVEKGAKKAPEKAPEKAPAKDERAERAEKREAKKEAKKEAKEEAEPEAGRVKNEVRRLSQQGKQAVKLASEAEAGNASMSEVRKVLEELIEAEPEAKSNPAVQAAYVALDNMEAEEVEAISAEAALLWKEQQGLERDLAKARHAHKIASVRLGWYDAAPQHVPEEQVPGEQRVGGGKEALDELLERVALEETNVARLTKELKANKEAIDELMEDMPERVVSSQRLSQLKLTTKHQLASTEALRYKVQARSMAGVLSEMLTVWGAAIPEDVQAQLREVCDLPGAKGAGANRHKTSIDTMRRMSLDSARGDEAKTKYDHAQEDDEDEDDEDEDVDVLDGAGVATPWRNLGALAKKSVGLRNDILEEDEDEDEEDASVEVVRKAAEELKNSRGKRKTVMKLVEEAATPLVAKKQARAAAKAGGAGVAKQYSDTPTIEEWSGDTPSTASSYESDRSSTKASKKGVAKKVGITSQPNSARSNKAAAKPAGLRPRATNKA